MASMAFFAKVSDPAVGGTYMTLLNTLSNLGGNWPATAALWFVDSLTYRQCSTDPSNDCSTIAKGKVRVHLGRRPRPTTVNIRFGWGVIEVAGSKRPSRLTVGLALRFCYQNRVETRSRRMFTAARDQTRRVTVAVTDFSNFSSARARTMAFATCSWTAITSRASSA